MAAAPTDAAAAAPADGPGAGQGPLDQHGAPPQQGPGLPEAAETLPMQQGLSMQQSPPGQTPLMPPGVPSPWQGPYYEPTTGRWYYFNLWTNQSEWAAPASLPAMYQYGTPNGYAAYPQVPMLTVAPQDAAAYGVGAYGIPAYDPLGQVMDRREQCSDFKRGKCDRGAACKYAHVKPTEECGDFKRGRCTRGSTCKYVHAGEGGTIRSRSRSR